VVERVAAGLRPDAEAVWADTDVDSGEEMSVGGTTGARVSPRVGDLFPMRHGLGRIVQPPG